MFGKLFATAEQRRDREILEQYDTLVEHYRSRKRSLRQKAVIELVTTRVGCAFLMNDIGDGFLVLDTAQHVIVEGRFIDRYLIRPEFIGDHETTERRIAAIEAYRDASKTGDVRVVRELSEEDEWFFPGEYERRPRVVISDYATRQHLINEMLYVAVRWNGQPLCSVDAFSPKPHLYFASYLPSMLRAQRSTAMTISSFLNIEIVLSGMDGVLLRYEQVYDDFNKAGVAKGEFESMLEMSIEFLTLAEQMTHASSARIKLDQDDEFYVHSVRQRIDDLDAVPGWCGR